MIGAADRKRVGEFESCFERLISYESVFSGMRAFKDRKQNWCISQEMANRYGWKTSLDDITLGTSMDILREQIWSPANCGDLPEPLRLTVFDCAFHHGLTQTGEMLRAAVGSKLENSQDPYLIRGKVMSQRLTFLSFADDWNELGQGWVRRVADILETA